MLKEGIDYYIDENGLFVFTGAFHQKRGYCCQNKCLHCPWNFGKTTKPGNSELTDEDE